MEEFKESAWELGDLVPGLALPLTSSVILDMSHLPGSQLAQLLNKGFELVDFKETVQLKMVGLYNQSLFFIYIFTFKGLPAELFSHHQVASVNLGLCVQYFHFPTLGHISQLYDLFSQYQPLLLLNLHDSFCCCFSLTFSLVFFWSWRRHVLLKNNQGWLCPLPSCGPLQDCHPSEGSRRERFANS